MREGEEIKIVFTGPMGSGKTTAIAAISDAIPVSTEVENLDRDSVDKHNTTVGLDFGQVALEDGQVLRLYGTPGQVRFDFMWRIIGEGALGVVLLLDATQVTTLADLDVFLDAYGELVRRQQVVVAVGRTTAPGAIAVADVARRIALRKKVLPVFSVDVRRREDVLLLIDALLNLIEASADQEEPNET